MSDGDPNDKTENPFDGLSFSPDWAKGDADSHYANLHRYAARFEDRDDRGDRRGGPRRDREKDLALQRHGWLVLRLLASDATARLGDVLDAILPLIGASVPTEIGVERRRALV